MAAWQAPPPEKRSRVEEEVEQWQRGASLQSGLSEDVPMGWRLPKRNGPA